MLREKPGFFVCLLSRVGTGRCNEAGQYVSHSECQRQKAENEKEDNDGWGESSIWGRGRQEGLISRTFTRRILQGVSEEFACTCVCMRGWAHPYMCVPSSGGLLNVSSLLNMSKHSSRHSGLFVPRLHGSCGFLNRLLIMCTTNAVNKHVLWSNQTHTW